MATDTISPEAIREAREATGLTQEQAAERTGLTRATIQNAETGRRSPAGYVLAALARVYDVSMDSFVIHEQEADTASTARGERIAQTHRDRPGCDSPVTGTIAAKGSVAR